MYKVIMILWESVKFPFWNTIYKYSCFTVTVVVHLFVILFECSPDMHSWHLAAELACLMPTSDILHVDWLLMGKWYISSSTNHQKLFLLVCLYHFVVDIVIFLLLFVPVFILYYSDFCVVGATLSVGFLVFYLVACICANEIFTERFRRKS